MDGPLKPLPSETEEEHRQFLGWVLSEPRKAVPSEALGLSVRNDWAARAGYHDTLQARGAIVVAAAPKTIAEKVRDLVDLELDKYLREAQERPNAPILSPAELIRFAQLLKPGTPDREPEDRPADDSGLRLSEGRARFEELSDEDLQALHDLRKELQ